MNVTVRGFMMVMGVVLVGVSSLWGQMDEETQEGAVAVTSQRTDWDRFGSFSVLPQVDIQPGFTQNPRQVLTLELSGIGREPITIKGIYLNDRPLPGSAWKTVLGTLQIAPNRDLSKGLNTITMVYEHPIDSKHKENPITFSFYVNYQPALSKVSFSDRGTLVVNGREIYMVGSYRSGQVDQREKALASAKAAGFHMVHEYNFESHDVIERKGGIENYLSWVRDYLQTADKLGLGVFMGLDRAAIRDFDEGTLARVICGLSNEPALWMWYIWDEPSEKKLLPENASRTYHLIKHLDPHHPAIMLPCRIRTAHVYGHYSDVVWYDRYPFIGTGPSLNSVAPATAKMQAMQALTGDKPLWFVPQIHDNKGSKALRKKVPSMPELTDANHRPNQAEMRAQTHMGIATGCTGIVYYWLQMASSYSMRDDTPKTWERFSEVIHEIRQLEPVLLSRDVSAGMDYQGGHDKVVVWQRGYQGKEYVGLVNGSCSVPTELLVVPSFRAESVKVVVGDGWAELTESGIEVRLGNAGVAVLEITPAR